MRKLKKLCEAYLFGIKSAENKLLDFDAFIVVLVVIRTIFLVVIAGDLGFAFLAGLDAVATFGGIFHLLIRIIVVVDRLHQLC